MQKKAIQEILESGHIDATLQQNSSHHNQIRSLQHLLHDLGFSRGAKLGAVRGRMGITGPAPALL